MTKFIFKCEPTLFNKQKHQQCFDSGMAVTNTNIHLNTTVMTHLEMDTFLIIFQFGAYAVSDITDMIQGVCAAVDAFVVNSSLFWSTFSCSTVLSLLAFALPHNDLLYF